MFRNRYETVFIITPVLSDEQTKEVVKKFKDLLKDKGANITHEENWGMRKLAYPIQKKSTGFYYLVEFDAEPFHPVHCAVKTTLQLFIRQFFYGRCF